MGDLVSGGTRGRFRDAATGSTVGVITTAFRDEGNGPDPSPTRRTGPSGGHAHGRPAERRQAQHARAPVQ